MSKKYKLVPVEPTREMWAAAGDAVVALSSHHHDAISEAVYKAMLAAAPEVEHDPVADALHARAMGLYRPPFRYDSFGGYIWDSENNMVADNHDLQDDAVLRIRGWGRISYMDDPEALQDKMGELVSAALTAYWTQPTEQKPELAAPAVQGEPVAWLRFRSHRVAADDVIEGLEICEPGETGDDGGPAFPVYATPQPSPTTQGEPVAWLPYLTDRADGVTGHYAIARKNPAGYREVWNLRSHQWAAFSDEVLTLDEALALLKKLEMPTAPQPSFQLPEFATDPDDSDEGASLWSHGFKQGWNSCLEAVAEGMQHTEQRKILDAEVTAESLVPLSDYQKLQDKCGVLVKDLELLLRRLEKMPRKLWLKEQLETILTTLAFEDEKESSHDNQ